MIFIVLKFTFEIDTYLFLLCLQYRQFLMEPEPISRSWKKCLFMKDKLMEEGICLLQHVSMGWLIHDPYIQVDKELLMALMERWYERTNLFHLSTREITIVLKDVHRILWVLMKGIPILFNEGMTYDQCRPSTNWFIGF